MTEWLPLRRCLAGLRDGCGRTLVVAGPPYSGKSEILADLRHRVEGLHALVLELRGSYRDRAVPFAAITPLAEAYARARDRGSRQPPAPGEPKESPPASLAFGFVPTEDETLPPPSRAGRRRNPPRILYGPGRPRTPAVPSPAEFWDLVYADMREDPKLRLALFVEDAGLFDAESREFLVELSDRARMAPFLISLALDSSLPGSSSWEEPLSGRGDVDWIRLVRSRPDPREVDHLRELFEPLPAAAQRSIGVVAILEGGASEVLVGRALNLNTSELADALFPAVDAGILRVANNRVQIAHDPWVAPSLELFGAPARREMERDIAQALEALNPEPTMTRRLEIGQHFFTWRHGIAALRALSEGADLAERAGSYDVAADALEKALACVNDLPVPERAANEAELQARRGRALLFAGLPEEGEQAVRAGFESALRSHANRERLEEMMLEALPALRLQGPRESMMAFLRELAQQARVARASSLEAMVGTLLSLLEIDRNRTTEAQDEAGRAVRASQAFPGSSAMGLALLAVANARVDGTEAERRVALRFVERARTTLSQLHRPELTLPIDEVQARLLAAAGDNAGAVRLHERSLPTAHRMSLAPLELYHHLHLAQVLMEGPRVAGIPEELRKARGIVERLRLLPPSPALISLWLLEGRWSLVEGRLEEARLSFRAVLSHTNRDALPRWRIEALLRLAQLDAETGQEAEMSRHLRLLTEDEVAASISPGQAERLRALIPAGGAGRTAIGVNPPPGGIPSASKQGREPAGK
ncbi:MAG TPA: hypothetical protein VJS68_04325 [Thermoplasmata archaeon]|nr:hypothetical protein [Thermoplasmata archaeon]